MLNAVAESGAVSGAVSTSVLDMLSDGLAVAGEVIAHTWNIIVGNPILSVTVTFGLITAGVGIFAAIKSIAR